MTNTQWKAQLEKQIEETKNNFLRLEGALQLVNEMIKAEPPVVEKPPVMAELPKLEKLPVKKRTARKVQTKVTTNE